MQGRWIQRSTLKTQSGNLNGIFNRLCGLSDQVFNEVFEDPMPLVEDLKKSPTPKEHKSEVMLYTSGSQPFLASASRYIIVVPYHLLSNKM